MALFKIRGCKSMPAKAISYISEGEKAEFLSSKNMDDSRNYAVQFYETAQLHSKGKKFDERKYYHAVLSCNRDDGVSAAAHHEYAEAVAARLFPMNECVIATHTDTDTTHSHIIINSINFETGKKLDIRNSEYRRMKNLANSLGVERGFSDLDWKKATQEKRQRIDQGEPQPMSRAEKEIIMRGGTSWKEDIREVILLAKRDTANISDFEKYLNSYGIELTRNTEKTIAFKHPEKEKSVRGEKLGEGYTKGAIIDELEKNRWQREQDGTGTITRTEQREPDRAGEQPFERSFGFVERELRGIDETVKSRTSEGREQQAERLRRAEELNRQIEQQQRNAKKRHVKRDRGFER